MRHTTGLMLLGALAISGCTREIELANNDSRGLVDALRRANATPGKDTISLARNGLYVLSREAEPGLLMPSVRGELEINGNGAEIRGYTPSKVALMEIGKDGDVILRGLSLAEGSNGALRNFGKLRLESSRIVDSIGSQASAIVLNHGRLVASGSEFAYNAIDDSLRDAGTVLNYGEFRLDHSRIHDNRVQRARPGLVAAGAVLNMGTLRVKASRVDNNRSDDMRHGGGPPGYLSFAGVLNLGNGRVEGELPDGSTRSASAALLTSAEL